MGQHLIAVVDQQNGDGSFRFDKCADPSHLLPVADRTEVYSQNPAWVSSGHLQINIRIPLPTVAYQDERLFRIGPQDVQDLVFLMRDMTFHGPAQDAGHTPEEDRAFGKAVVVKEEFEVSVQVPRTMADVKHRIGLLTAPAPVQHVVKARRSLQGDAPVCPFEEGIGDHLPLHIGGHPRVQYGIVNIGDNPEGSIPVRDQQGSGESVFPQDGMSGLLPEIKGNLIGKPAFPVYQGMQVSHGFIQQKISVGVGLHLKTPAIRQGQSQRSLADLIRFETPPTVEEQLNRPFLSQVNGLIFQGAAAGVEVIPGSIGLEPDDL